MAKEVKKEDEEAKIQEGLRLEMEAPADDLEPVEGEPGAEDGATPDDKTAVDPDATPEEEAEPVEGTQTDGAEEEKAPEADAEKNEQGKPYYTDAEILALIEEGEDGKKPELDTSRIKPGTTAAAMYKRTVGELTPKLQEGAEYRKEVDALNKQVKAITETQQAQQAQQPRTWEEAAAINPNATMGHIDALIAQETQKDPFGEKLAEYRTIKDGLTTLMLNQQTERVERSSYDTTAIQEAEAEAIKIAPDFYSNWDKYKEHALGLGYTAETLNMMLDAPRMKREGRSHIPLETLQIIKNSMEREAKLKPPVDTKELVKKKKAPTKVEGAGEGFEEPKKETGWDNKEAVEFRQRSSIT